ncbi:hypothetical protein KC367_g163 [Hortaea werneckii]|nr:hypothetical protein KC367_g163 [Hortaea werneckii]
MFLIQDCSHLAPTTTIVWLLLYDLALNTETANTCGRRSLLFYLGVHLINNIAILLRRLRTLKLEPVESSCQRLNPQTNELLRGMMRELTLE